MAAQEPHPNLLLSPNDNPNRNQYRKCKNLRLFVADEVEHVVSKKPKAPKKKPKKQRKEKSTPHGACENIVTPFLEGVVIRFVSQPVLKSIRLV